MLAPTGALISTEPVPVPLLEMVPALFTLVLEIVMPLAMALLLLMMRLPVPINPPETVNTFEPLALLLVSVVPLVLTVIAPLTVNAEVVLF